MVEEGQVEIPLSAVEIESMGDRLGRGCDGRQPSHDRQVVGLSCPSLREGLPTVPQQKETVGLGCSTYCLQPEVCAV